MTLFNAVFFGPVYVPDVCRHLKTAKWLVEGKVGPAPDGMKYRWGQFEGTWYYMIDDGIAEMDRPLHNIKACVFQLELS